MEERKIFEMLMDELNIPKKSKTKLGYKYDRNIIWGFIKKYFKAKSNRLHLPVILFFAITILSPLIAQTIEVKENIADSSKYGEIFSAPAAYDKLTQTILLNKYDYDYKLIKMFLHELGHHIWFYGGVDTTAILADLEGEYFTKAEIKEMFADQHWRYFFDDASPAFRNIFYSFYNREESKK